MTKHYHLTPEQAYRIALRLDKEGFNITTYPNGYIEAFGGREFQAFANAVLDEVLGEPVLYASPDYEQLLKYHNGHTLCGGKPSELHTLELYAPKGLT